jgi:hypothetical protein
MEGTTYYILPGNFHDSHWHVSGSAASFEISAAARIKASNRTALVTSVDQRHLSDRSHDDDV